MFFRFLNLVHNSNADAQEILFLLRTHLPPPWVKLERIFKKFRVYMNRHGAYHDHPTGWNCIACNMKTVIWIGTRILITYADKKFKIAQDRRLARPCLELQPAPAPTPPAIIARPRMYSVTIFQIPIMYGTVT